MEDRGEGISEQLIYCLSLTDLRRQLTPSHCAAGVFHATGARQAQHPLSLRASIPRSAPLPEPKSSAHHSSCAADNDDETIHAWATNILQGLHRLALHDHIRATSHPQQRLPLINRGNLSIFI